MKHTKVLHVVRHAKSSWEYDDTADIDRTLKNKGIKSAYGISRKLKLTNKVPGKIFSSPAIRALHTSVIFARVLEFPVSDIEINNILYESSANNIVELIRNQKDDCTSIMIFGHNPDFTDLVNLFVKPLIDNIPTAGVVTLKFNSDTWKGIDKENLEKFLINFPDMDD